jgi:hypothetical protein
MTNRALSRRSFLKLLGTVTGGLALPFDELPVKQNLYLPIILGGPIPLPDPAVINLFIGSYADAFGFLRDDVLSRLLVSATEPFVGYDPLTGVPLMLANRSSSGNRWEWEKLTLRNVSRLARVDLGTSSAGSDVGWDTTAYQTAAGENFSTLKAIGFSPDSMQQWPNMPGLLADIADDYDMRLYTGALFSHYDQDPALVEIGNPSLTEVRASMERRIRDVYSYILRAGSGGQVDVVAEAMWWWQGQGGWEESVYYSAFQEDVIIEAYIMAYEIAQDMGMQIGKDLLLIYNDYAIEIPGPKSEFVYEHLARSKEGIAARLGVTPEEVMLGVGIEFHVFTDQAQTNVGGTYIDDISKAKLIDNFRRFSEIGPVYITELQVNYSQNLEVIQGLIRLVIDAALQSQLVKGITFYETLRFENLWYAINSGIFTREFQPTRFYYDIVSLCYKAAARS